MLYRFWHILAFFSQLTPTYYICFENYYIFRKKKLQKHKFDIAIQEKSCTFALNMTSHASR